MSGRTEQFTKNVRDTFEHSILKFIGDSLHNSGSVIDKAHEIWIFSMAYSLLKKKEYLIAAINAKEYFVENFVDHKFGGVFWSVKKGKREDTTARLVAQGTAISALSAFYKATKDDEALKAAVNIYKVVEKEFHCRECNDYKLTLTREFVSVENDDDNYGKAVLALLHGYTALYKAWNNEGMYEDLKGLLNLVCGKAESFEPRRLNETSWAILDAAFALRDIDVINETRPLALKFGEAGANAISCVGSEAHSGIAGLWLWKYVNHPEGAERAIATWDKFSGDSELMKREPYKCSLLAVELLGNL